MFRIVKYFSLFLIIIIAVTSCGNKKFGDTRKTPVNALERAKKNVEEGRGASIGNIIGGRNSTTFEFSTSNPMWRASLEVLDFIPMTTVDYAGGMIITDWYTDNNKNNESVKITLRFLANEIRSDSLKIIVHKKICKTTNNCVTNISNSALIKNELRSTILRKATLLAQTDKKKK